MADTIGSKRVNNASTKREVTPPPPLDRGEPDGSACEGTIEAAATSSSSSSSAITTSNTNIIGGPSSPLSFSHDDPKPAYHPSPPSYTTTLPPPGKTIMTEKTRPYSLYDIGKKFYTLSEASLRKSHQQQQHHHTSIVKCNSIGKCNSVVDVAAKYNSSSQYSSDHQHGKATTPPSAYSEIERFNRTLESEGVYMRNTSIRGSTSYSNGGVITSDSAYGTLQRANTPSLDEEKYGVTCGGGGTLVNGQVQSNNEHQRDFHGVDYAVEDCSGDGGSGAGPLQNSVASNTTMTKTGRIKRVKRTGFMALRVGRFTKNGEKKSTNNKPLDVKNDVNDKEINGPIYSVDPDRPLRANSLDYLNFEEKRKLIASSLSLSECISNNCAGGDRQSRQLYGVKVTTEGSGYNMDNESVKNSGRRDNSGSGGDVVDGGEDKIERRLERFGIGLVGMSNSNAAGTPPNSTVNHMRTHSVPTENRNLISRPSSPLVQHHMTLPASLPATNSPILQQCGGDPNIAGYNAMPCATGGGSGNVNLASGNMLPPHRLQQQHSHSYMANHYHHQHPQQGPLPPSYNSHHSPPPYNMIYGMSGGASASSGGGTLGYYSSSSTSCVSNSGVVDINALMNATTTASSAVRYDRSCSTGEGVGVGNPISAKSKAMSLSLSDLLTISRTSKGTSVVAECSYVTCSIIVCGVS